MKGKDKPRSLEKAKEYCFLLLKFRLRSEKEICQRLKQKNFNEAVIKGALDFLKEYRFIDDALFAKTWIESRLKKPLGIRKIKEELKIKGIDKEIIEDALGQIQPGYSEEEVVSRLTRDRLKKPKGIEPQKAKRRVFAYLLRRGFSPDIVMDVVVNKFKED